MIKQITTAILILVATSIGAYAQEFEKSKTTILLFGSCQKSSRSR
jgi:hypothetical protein